MTYVLALIALISFLGMSVSLISAPGIPQSPLDPVIACLLLICMTLALFGIAALNKLDAIRDRLTPARPKEPSKSMEDRLEETLSP